MHSHDGFDYELALPHDCDSACAVHDFSFFSIYQARGSSLKYEFWIRCGRYYNHHAACKQAPKTVY